MKNFEIRTRAFSKGLKEKLPNVFKLEFGQDINIRVMIVIFAILLSIIWIFSFIRFQPSDFMVPLRYNSFLGVTQLGFWYNLYSVPVFLTLCSFLNLVLAEVIYKKDRMISYILVGSNIFLAAASLAVVINLAFISGI